MALPLPNVCLKCSVKTKGVRNVCRIGTSSVHCCCRVFYHEFGGFIKTRVSSYG
ncbi:Uncharacterised protein [Vibrio cholerae]|nr:Uncharacterised protein [Vibrio cholerae]